MKLNWLGIYILFVSLQFNAILYCSGFNETEKIDFVFSANTDVSRQYSEANFSDIKFRGFEDLDFGFYKGALWVKVSVYNYGTANSFVLHNSDMINRTYKIYELDSANHKLIPEINRKIKFGDQRSFNVPRANFKFDLKSGESVTYIIYCWSDGRVLDGSLEITNLDDYLSGISFKMVENGFFYGAAFIILLINLFQWKNWRKKIYIYYAIFIVSTCLIYVCIEGYLFIFESKNYIIEHLIFFMIRLWSFSLVLFTATLFQIHKSAPKFRVFLNWLMLVVFGSLSAYQLLFFNTSVSHLHMIEASLVGLWIIVVIIIITKSTKERRIETRYYLIALISFLVCVLIGILSNYGSLIPGDGSTYLKIGTLLELSVFTYAISFVLLNNEKKVKAIESKIQLIQAEFKKDLSAREKNTEVLNDKYNDLKLSVKKMNDEGRMTKSDLVSIFKLLESNAKSEEDWINFKSRYANLNPNFLPQLITKHSNLSKSDIRLLVLVKIGFSQKEISSIIGIAYDSVKKSKHRVRKKMNLRRDITLVDYMTGI